MSKEKNAREKRTYQRFDVDGLDGTMVLASDVKIINLSLGGAAIEADRRLDRGRRYSLRISNQSQDLILTGKIAWSKFKRIKKDKGGENRPVYKAGIKFVDTFDPKVEGLLKFIDENKDQEEKRLSGIRFQIQSKEMAVLDERFRYSVKKISLGGMLIESEQELLLNKHYQMELSIDGAPFLFTGRIASSLINDKAKFDIGIAFENLTAELKERLEKLINNL